MSQPLPPLVAALGLAHTFITLDCPQLAAAVLATHLATVSPEDAAADPVLIDAAILLARTGRRVDWARYAHRASRTLGADVEQTARASAVLKALERGEADLPLPGADADFGGPDAFQRAKLCLGRFDAAYHLHCQGRCAEGVRAASRALDDFLHQHLTVAPVMATPMITRLAAMLSACRRDTEARDLLAEHAARLPAPGTPARREFATIGLPIMDLIDRQHAPHCAVRHDTGRHFRAVICSGADGQPWGHRRDDWRRLLAGDTRADSR